MMLISPVFLFSRFGNISVEYRNKVYYVTCELWESNLKLALLSHCETKYGIPWNAVWKKKK